MMNKVKRSYKKVKMGVVKFMAEKIDLVQRMIGSYDKKIVIGTFVTFIGAGLITAGLVEKTLMC